MEFFVDEPEPYIPDHLTLPQFMWDTSAVARPHRGPEIPYFIEEATGRKIFEEEASPSATYALAKALRLKWDIGKDAVVCVFSPNDVDYAVLIWAIHLLGAIVTPGNPFYTAEELAHQIKLTKASLVIAHPVCQETVFKVVKENVIPESRVVILRDPIFDHIPTLSSLMSLGDSSKEVFEERRLSKGEARKALAFLSLSSGTTGPPKAVAITHFAVLANLLQMSAHCRINDSSWPNKLISLGDVGLGVLPFFHIYGLVVLLHFQLFCGASILVVPKFDFRRFLQNIDKYRVSILLLVPPQIVLLCKQEAVKKYDFSHVKLCMSGAAPLSGELCASLKQIFPNATIGQSYGLTETVATVSFLRPDTKDIPVGSCGRLAPGIRARVIKPDGTMAGEGEEGELLVTGPAMALGYLDNEAATNQTFVDSWVHTGDVVIIRNNEVYVVDRVKEVLKVKGFQVTPAELEGHLLLHSDIVDSCVVGIKDDYSGELPFAYVVLRPTSAERIKGNPAAAQELKKLIFKHVADSKVRYKWLTGGIEFLDAIPKNPTGKILRRVLREKARSLPTPAKTKL
ncbi:putative acyl-CoA synthetase [Agaricus bisporus var. bisporus H97]|uniref:putative acyl-CoA synthetase n=1 Tax=Agaricus bisporus var. bisporus (strain H97 / ATCC MYA-4626 / FGSC 10389) TaxID=936046 RepID=UPI00029F6178|nr:putative acyl-CoA synthetase [Agaricus bisporus var. bisporus H97]EKV52012.1 putative acyl-CoA synthetase [Agaricus bisporus var. bisporus H97]